MKKIISIIVLICLLVSVGWSQTYRERVRQNVISKMRFYFVEDPTQPFPTSNRAMQAMEINKVAISNNQSISSPLWTDAANAGLKDLLIKILRRTDQGGEFRLQEKLNSVLLISNKQVIVFLYADFNNPVFHSSWRNRAPYCRGGVSGSTEGGCYPAGHGNASWPCARHYPRDNIVGDIGLGAYYYSSSYTDESAREKRSTIIHELTHTQLPISDVTYGPDNNHYFSEILPSRNSAFDEGLANAFAYRYYLPTDKGMTRWFNDNKKLFVENWTGCSGEQCIQTRLASASVNTQTCPSWIATRVPSGARCYNIRDIPAEIMLYNENTSANILYQYMAQFRYGEYFLVRDLRTAKTRMQAASYKFGPLFKQMVRRGMNWRLPNQPAGTVTHGQFLPVGILDYYTGYHVNSKAVLGRTVGSTWTTRDTNIDDYFAGSNQRNVLLSYRSNPTEWHVSNQLSRFARHLNVRPPLQQASNSSSGGD